jgi:D-serine deaminase-like pyridoxal phosphate-dependent protein
MATNSLQKRAQVTLPDKGTLVQDYVGKNIADLPTPLFVVDRSIAARNCTVMHEVALQWDANFRAHVKTHKVVSAVAQLDQLTRID